MASSRNSPSTKQFESSVRERLAGAIPHGAHVVVALSGGLDSCVLLSLASAYAAGGACRLSALHVHHGISEHAEAWVDFCTRYCEQFAVPLQVSRIQVPRNSPEGLEAAARRLRYAILDAHPADHVLLGHHADDQAETLLLNLLRGAGVRGAASMLPVYDSEKRYHRPMLAHPRQELEAYAALSKLHWVDDESNTDISLSRNYIRHQVIPVLQSRFPSAVENLARSAEHFAEAQEMLDILALQDLGEHPPAFPVPVSLLSTLNEPRARNVMRYLLAASGLQSPSSKRLNEALRQFIAAAPDRHPSLILPAYVLRRVKGRIVLELPYS